MFGSIFGGAIGFALGGPLGAVLGAMVGGSTGGASPQQHHRQHSPHELQTAFTIALVSLAAKVSKADGRVCENEIRAFDDFLKNNMRLSNSERKKAAKIFNIARDNSHQATDFALQLRQIFSRDPNRLRDIVTLLFMIALADGALHPLEENLIQRIAAAMGLSHSDVENCKATFTSTQRGSTISVGEAYKVLGVNESASDDEVRRAHRKLVREYHPDVLTSKGLPEDFLEYSKKKMAAINDAWDAVKSHRQI
ncbi:MAG: co-chaperone DjlA [Planctomycetota bacterium]|nr:co-chaperone DjlA [Planctomycetota bacterium]